MPSIKCENCGESFLNKTQRRVHAKKCGPVGKSNKSSKINAGKKDTNVNLPTSPTHEQKDS